MPQFTIEKMQMIWLDYETIQLSVASIKQTTTTAWNQSKQKLRPSYVGRGCSDPKSPHRNYINYDIVWSIA